MSELQGPLGSLKKAQTRSALAQTVAAGMMQRPYLLLESRQVSAAVSSDDHLRQEPLSLNEREGEDAYLTGSTRSLHRRLLALNLQGKVVLPKEDCPEHVGLTDTLIA